MVCHNKGKTQGKGVRQRGAEEETWAEQCVSNRTLEKTSYLGASSFVLPTRYVVVINQRRMWHVLGIRYAHKILTRKPGRNISFGTPSCRWEMISE